MKRAAYLLCVPSAPKYNLEDHSRIASQVTSPVFLITKQCSALNNKRKADRESKKRCCNNKMTFSSLILDDADGEPHYLYDLLIAIVVKGTGTTTTSCYFPNDKRNDRTKGSKRRQRNGTFIQKGKMEGKEGGQKNLGRKSRKNSLHTLPFLSPSPLTNAISCGD